MERISRVRAIALIIIFALIIGFFAVRLFQLQIIETDGNTDNTTIYTSLTRVKASRGDILDRNGNILVGNRASYDLVFNHNVIISYKASSSSTYASTNEALYALVKKCQELDIEYRDDLPITRSRPYEYTLDEFTSTWQGYFQQYLADVSLDSDITAPLLMSTLRERYKIPDTWTDEEARAVIGLRYEFDLRGVVGSLSNYVFLEDVSDVDLSALKELNIPGLMVESSTVREYHTKYAAHILGTMGKMSTSQWTEYKEKGYAMDAVVGQSGFELAFEEYLHATDGTRIDKVDRNGTIISQEYKEGYEPKAGNNVETTIDLNIQIIAEDALSDVIEWLKNPETNDDSKGAGLDVEGAAVVVMEVKTGDVLACASYPTYNPITYNEDYDKIMEADYDPLFNRAFHATYAPGSSYKPCTLIAAMMAGKYQVGETIYDDGVFRTYEDQGFAPKCLYWSQYRLKHGDTTAQYALEVSCNYFFYELGDRLTANELDSTAKALGLGESTGIELSEDVGHRANAETKELLYGVGNANSKFSAASKVLAAIGQDENSFSPMQMAVYTSTLANKGTRMKATFLSRVVASDYSALVMENQPKVVSKLDISDEIYNTYLEGMVNVVSGSHGTARKTLANMPVTVAAKTGTAQHGSGGSDNAAFICFAPAEDPEIAIAVYGEKAAHGATLGRVAKAIIEYYFADDVDVSDVTYLENALG